VNPVNHSGIEMSDETPNATEAPPRPEQPQPGELEALRAKLEATEKQLANYQLVVADYENARKRTLRDAEVAKKYVAEPLARDLLGALDNLDRALGAAKQAGDSGPLATGVAATAEQMLAVLRRHGIVRMECGPGTPFDPNLHEAVMQQPAAEFGPGHIVQVLQHGFMLHDRVLRPASVIVAA
jgi:molecular chaperone GrpE